MQYISLKFLTKIVCGACIISSGIFYDATKIGIDEMIPNQWIIDDSDLKPIESSPSSTIIQPSKSQLQESNKVLLSVIKSNLSQTHWIWDNLEYSENLYNKLCKWYSQICDRTIFNWTFTYKEKIVYQGIILFLIRTIDRYMTYSKKLSDTIYSIRLNKDIDWRRWYAGHHSITINLWWIKSNKELKEVITHELWHVIDLGIIWWYSTKLDTDYTEFGEESFSIDDHSLEFYNLSWLSEKIRKDISSYKDFVSWYALTDPFEDFAECVNLYLNHYKVFAEMSKTNYIISQKFEFMKQLFWNKYIFTDQANLSKIQSDSTRRPWDSTKIK